MKKIFIFLAVWTSIIVLDSCSGESAAERQLMKMQVEQITKDGERQNPKVYIDVEGEIIPSDKFFSSKSTIRGQIKSNAQYTTYTSVTIKVSFFSKNNILVGSEFINFNEKLTKNYKTFEKKTKLPKGVSSCIFEIVSANAVQ